MNLYSNIKKNLNEADDTIKERKIPIGLNDEKSKEIINAVCGQLSDGIWENSPGMDKYWQFMGDLDDNGNLTVYNGYKRSYNTMSPWCYSAFNDMDDTEVKKYYANKIKQIVKREGLDWDRNNTKQCDYLDYHSGVTVRDAYKVYDRLLGRIDRIVDSEKLKESENGTKTFNGYLYHCSNSPIEQFDTNHFEEDSLGGVSRGFGIYFCATEEAAKSYQSKRKPYILKCKVECDNVIDYNEYKRLINQSEQENIGNNTFHAWHPETIRETMLNNNVDALIDSYDDQNILEMVVYNLDCIKNVELISQLKESNINESGPYYIGPKEYCMIAKNDEDSDLLSLYLDNNKYAEEVIPKNWSEDKIRKLAGKISNSEGPRGDRDFVKEVEQESLTESENTLFCIQDTSHPDFTNKGYQTTQFNDLIAFTNKEDAQKYINYLNTLDKNEYKIVDATTFDKDKMTIFNTFDEYKKSLNESETEDYWDATELDRVGFMALLKFNSPEKHANPSMEYIITNDNNEVYRFAIEGSTEKIKDIGAKIEFRKYLNNKEDELNVEGFDNFEIPAYNIKGVFNKDTGEVIYTVGSNSTNRNEYRKNINDLKQEEFPSTHEGIVRKYIENTILKEAEGPYNQAFKVGSKLDLLLSELNTELSKCLKDMGYDEEFKKDYTSIEAKENENNTEIYFIAELDYKEGEKIVQQLDDIISKYDKDAYFEAEDTGRWVAVINKNMNESEDGIIPQSKFKNMTDEDLDNYVKFLKEELMYHTTEKQKELQKDIEKIEQILRDRDFYIDSSDEDAYNIEIVKGWKDMTQEELDKYIEDNK